MKTGTVTLIDSKHNRIEVQGGTTGAIALSMFAFVTVFGVLKLYELYSDLQIELETIRNPSADGGRTDR